MQDALRLRFRRTDLIAAGLVLLLAAALALWLAARAAAVETAAAQIYVDGALTAELPLDRDGTYEVRGDYRNTVTVRDGRVAVTDSDCPGGDCLHSGWISTAGRSIVCLPNRMEVRLTGVESDGVDIAIGGEVTEP